MELGEPVLWCLVALALWTLVFIARRQAASSAWEQLQLQWGLFSTFVFILWLRRNGADFKGWADVYYMCGSSMQFCTCDYRWNLDGYIKGLVLVSFVISTAVALQSCVVHYAFGGLLPEEVSVTRECCISLVWRLVPYALNAWERAWGTETSSAMLELPQYALEMLVVLPSVQIMCSRLRILAQPQMRVLVDQDEIDVDQIPPEHLAPNIMEGHWEYAPRAGGRLARLRRQRRPMALVAAITALAVFNAVAVPRLMENSIGLHERTPVMLDAAARQQALHGQSPSLVAALGLHDTCAPTPQQDLLLAYQGKGCPSMHVLGRAMEKHGRELGRMFEAEHRALVPRVELALALMRMSCEHFWVLATLFAAYLLFREPPAAARLLIRTNALVSQALQRVILISFPLVCWIYGSGVVFSTLVSMLFWGSYIGQAVLFLRTHAYVVRITGLRPATASEFERSEGMCPICWEPFNAHAAEPHQAQNTAGSAATSLVAAQAVAAGAAAESAAPRLIPGSPDTAAPADDTAANGIDAVALQCSHCFHRGCIQQWLHQNHRQRRKVCCPMCNAEVALESRWRFPLPRLQQPAPAQQGGQDAAEDADPAPQHQQLMAELQALLDQTDAVRRRRVEAGHAPVELFEPAAPVPQPIGATDQQRAPGTAATAAAAVQDPAEPGQRPLPSLVLRAQSSPAELEPLPSSCGSAAALNPPTAGPFQHGKAEDSASGTGLMSLRRADSTQSPGTRRHRDAMYLSSSHHEFN